MPNLLCLLSVIGVIGVSCQEYHNPVLELFPEFKQLQEGVKQLQEGTKQLQEGVKQLQEGAKQLQEEVRVLKGEKGDRGLPGRRGNQGPEGPPGPKGDRGLDVHCPYGYTYYPVGGFCYKFIPRCKTWSDARRHCQNEGGDLVMLKTDVIAILFQEIAKSHHGRNKATESKGMQMQGGYWIGASDIASERNWTWVDGSSVDLSRNWANGEPNNDLSEEHCLAMWKKAEYKFNDENCDLANRNQFVCAV